MSHPDLERALALNVRDVGELSMDELCEHRALVGRVEEQMSYLRRVSQSRTDMVRSELTERAAGSARSDLSDIIRRLPSVLAEGGHSSGATGVVAPDIDVDPAYATDLDAVIPPVRLLDVGSFSRTELRELAVRLEAIEARISVQRRLVQERADAVDEEIARREDLAVHP